MTRIISKTAMLIIEDIISINHFFYSGATGRHFSQKTGKGTMPTGCYKTQFI